MGSSLSTLLVSEEQRFNHALSALSCSEDEIRYCKFVRCYSRQIWKQLQHTSHPQDAYHILERYQLIGAGHEATIPRLHAVARTSFGIL